MITFVWAEDENHGIGKNGHLPWHLPADLKHFKEKTINHSLLMGRKTFTSLPHLLPGRVHLVLTHDRSLKEEYSDNPKVKFFYSWTELNSYLDKNKDQNICAIGGRSIFAGLINKVDVLEKTEIHYSFSVDVYMCPIDYDQFELVKKESHSASDKNKYNYDFLTYRRKN